MTVSSTALKQIFSGDGSTTTFAIPFTYPGTTYVLTASDLEVILRDESDPTDPDETVILNGMGAGKYTISGTNVVMGTAPPSSSKLLVKRVMPLTQGTSYSTTGPFPAASHEAALDYLTLAVQQLDEEISRAPKFMETSPTSNVPMPEPSVGASLIWNSTADGLENGATQGDISAAVTYAANALASQNSAATSATASAASATAAAASATAAAASATSSTLSVIGSHASPTSITAGGGISVPVALRTKQYVKGNSGAVTVSANPQIAAGTSEGQELILFGSDPTNTLQLGNGNGLVMNGFYILTDGSVIKFNWDSGQSLWVEEYRNAI